MKEKITLKKELAMLLNVAATIVVFTVFLYFFNLNLWVDIVVIVSVSLPTLYLHLQYAYSDRNKSLVLDKSSVHLEINDKVFDLSLANKIIINGHVALTRNVIPVFVSPNYYNVTFISKEFGEVSVFSLVYRDLKSIIMKHFDEEIIYYEHFLLY